MPTLMHLFSPIWIVTYMILKLVLITSDVNEVIYVIYLLIFLASFLLTKEIYSTKINLTSFSIVFVPFSSSKNFLKRKLEAEQGGIGNNGFNSSEGAGDQSGAPFGSFPAPENHGPAGAGMGPTTTGPNSKRPCPGPTTGNIGPNGEEILRLPKEPRNRVFRGGGLSYASLL